MRRLDRLVVWSFLRLFLAFTLTAPLLFILADATENLDNYLSDGVAFGDALISYLYMYPQFLYWSFPIAALLGVVFTIHPMTANREVMAAKAGGIPFHRLALPVFVLGALLTGVDLVLSEVAPRASRTSAELRGALELGQDWRSDFVYITERGESLSVRRLTVNDGRMLDVSLQRPGSEGEGSIEYIEAGQARWWEGNGWLFQEGVKHQIFPDDRETTVAFESALIRTITERPEDLLQRSREENEMTFSELRRHSERLERSGGSVGRSRTRMEQRVAIPAMTFIIILFGAPLATSSRRGGTAFGVGVSLATFITYMILFRVFANLGYADALSPTVAAWLPNVLFLLAALVLLRRVRT